MTDICGFTEERKSGTWVCTGQPHTTRGHYFERRKKPLCPECLAGKHGNCDGDALDSLTDEVVECDCYRAFHPGGTDG